MSANPFQSVANEVVVHIINQRPIHQLVALGFTDHRLKNIVDDEVSRFKQSRGYTDDDFVVYLWMHESPFWKVYARNAGFYTKLELTLISIVNNKRNVFTMPENRLAPLMQELQYGSADDAEDYYNRVLHYRMPYKWDTFKDMPGQFVTFTNLVFYGADVSPHISTYAFFLAQPSPFVEGPATSSIFPVSIQNGEEKHMYVTLANDRATQDNNVNSSPSVAHWVAARLGLGTFTGYQYAYEGFAVICRKPVPQTMANRIFANIVNENFPANGDVWDELYTLL